MFQLKKTLVNDGDIKVIANKFNRSTQGKTKLISWSAGPTDPTLSKNKKIILQNFGQLAFVFNLLVFAF